MAGFGPPFVSADGHGGRPGALYNSDVTSSGYLVFVDESGDHGLETIDAQYPVFVLAFCVISQLDYSRVLLPAVTEFKCGHFGHDQVILHERDIRKDLGDFAVLRDKVRKQAFLDELTAIIDIVPMTIIACAIRKDRLVDRYAYPNNPYELALGLGLERVARWLEKRSQKTTTVIVECRGRREDDELELEFRRCVPEETIGTRLWPSSRVSYRSQRTLRACRLRISSRVPSGGTCWIHLNRTALSKLFRESWIAVRQGRFMVGASRSSRRKQKAPTIRRGPLSTGNPQSLVFFNREFPSGHSLESRIPEPFLWNSVSPPRTSVASPPAICSGRVNYGACGSTGARTPGTPTSGALY